MSTTSYLVRSPREAHTVVNDLYQQEIKPHTKKGAAGLLTWQTVNTHKRHQMRKAFHGPILRDISEQVWLPDPTTGKLIRYSKAAWKELLRDWFIPAEPQEYVTKAGEIKVRMVKRSTEDMSDDQFQEFLLQAQAFAVVDLNVEFSEQEPEDHEGAHQ